MKKWITALLLMLLCLCGTAACGQDSASETESASAPAGQQDAATQDSNPSSEDASEPVEEDNTAAAELYVNNLPLEAQVAQMFFARCPEVDAVTLAGEYSIGGYILFGRDFEGQTPDSVTATIQSYQDAAATPMLIGVDEEGGTVVRISSNPNFRAVPFHSPQSLYNEGGFDLITSDTKEKDELLASIGVNVNFAPVCDVSTDPNDFINARAFGQDAAQTSEYVRTVVAQMLADNTGMVLKHFPGYGSNRDTHTGIAVDQRPLEQFRQSDFLPFQAGIDAGAGGVLVSHNIVTCLDPELPASLSPASYQVLREELGFEGVAMTDDLDMDAVQKYVEEGTAPVMALQAGADLVLTSDPQGGIPSVLEAVETGALTWDRLDQSVLRVLRWKLQLGLLSLPGAEDVQTS